MKFAGESHKLGIFMVNDINPDSSEIAIDMLPQEREASDNKERFPIGSTHTSLSPKAQLEKEKKTIKNLLNPHASLEFLKTETLTDENERIIGRLYVVFAEGKEFNIKFLFENGKPFLVNIIVE